MRHVNATYKADSIALPQVLAPAKLVTDSWVASAGGDFDTASNWSLGAVPDSNDKAVINTASVQSITHNAGSDIVGALSVGNDFFNMGGGSLDVLATASFADGYTQVGGGFSAGTLSIKGGATIVGGVLSTGKMTVSGTLTLANVTLAGATDVNVKFTDETAQVVLGDDTGVNATIDTAKGGTYSIAGDYGITQGAASASVVNGGLLTKIAGDGTSDIGVSVTSTGTLSAVSGNLEFDGPANVIGGKLTGAGIISFGGSGSTQLTLGTATLGGLGLYGSAVLTLEGATADLNGALYDQSSGNTLLDVQAGTFTVGGAAIFAGNFGAASVTGSGGGVLNLDGGATVSNAIFGGTITVNNAGTFSETGGFTLGDGSGGSVTFNNVAGGSYLLTTDNGVSAGVSPSSTIVNAGLFEKSGGTNTSMISVLFNNQSDGTIDAASGTVLFASTLTSSGTISGTGQVAVDGTATLSAGTVLSVAELGLYGSGVLNLGLSLNYGGVFADDSSGTDTLGLGANTLTLTGTGNTIVGAFGEAVVNGTGQLVNAKGGTLTVANAVLGGTDTLVNDGVIYQTNNFDIGDGSGAVASVSNAKGATWSFSGDVNLLDGASPASNFTNSGVLSVTAGTGTATIDTAFNNKSGATINVVSGSLANTGTLTNSGTLTGNDLQLTNSSQTTLASGSNLSLSSLDLYGSATLTLAANQTFGGAFNDDSNGTDVVNLGANNFTLNGAASFIGAFGDAIVTGAGTLFVNGAASLANALVGGTATFDNAGTLLATGELQIGDSGGNAAIFLNAAKGVYDVITESAGLQHGASLLSDFINDGLYEKTSGTGTTVIAASFVNNGTITVTSGTVEILAGYLSGSGVINGTETYDNSGDLFITPK
jgi:hypothetical protein